MNNVRVTHIGGPTTLIEVGGWRLLTDPTFDAPGRRYTFGWGTGSTKLAGPAIAAPDLAPIHAVLLTHDHHNDNLDPSGRALLPSADTVVTTASGAKRLGGNARGLEPWGTKQLEAPGRPPIEIIATPCRHGPPLSRSITGDVIGFALRWPAQEHGVKLEPVGVRGAVESVAGVAACDDFPVLLDAYVRRILVTTREISHYLAVAAERGVERAVDVVPSQGPLLVHVGAACAHLTHPTLLGRVWAAPDP